MNAHPRHSLARPTRPAGVGAWMLWCVILPCLLCHASPRRTISIPSPARDRNLRASVVLPASYRTTTRAYPVIYLLHGYASSHRVWRALAPLQALADTHQVIFVAPQGDPACWWLDSPLRPTSRFAHYVLNEVLPAIDTLYRTIPHAGGRALLGSSMGGHGALTLYARRPDLFAAAAGIGAIPDLRAFPDQYDIATVLGPLDEAPERWRRYSFIGMLDALPRTDTAIVLEIGAADPALASNRRTHALLDSAGIPHIYHESPGGHTRAFVKARFPEVVAWLVGRLMIDD